MELVYGADGTPLAADASVITPQTPNAITPSDTTNTSTLAPKGLLVTAGGTLAIRGIGNAETTHTFTVVAGQYIPIACSRVMAATNATVIGLG